MTVDSDADKLHSSLRCTQAELAACRRSAEDSKKSEARFRFLVEQSGDVVYRYRLVPTRGFDYISPAVGGVTGHLAGEFYADPNFFVRVVHREDRRGLNRYLRSGEFGKPLALRCVKKEGGVVWLELHCLPAYSEDGTLRAVEGVARDLSERRHLLEDSARLQREVDRRREAEELVREFSARTVAFQEEERRRVARELHDGVNQWLCAVGFGLETVSKEVTGEQAVCALAKARELLDRSIDEIRRISQTLRPGLLDDLGLVPAVRSLCDEFQNRTGITVNHDLDLGDQEHPAPVKTTAYRIIQEALYSSEPGKSGELFLQLWQDAAVLVTEIGARGATVPAGDGLWSSVLDSLRERAGLVGGTVRLEAADGGRLLVRLPLGEERLNA